MGHRQPNEDPRLLIIRPPIFFSQKKGRLGPSRQRVIRSFLASRAPFISFSTLTLCSDQGFASSPPLRLQLLQVYTNPSHGGTGSTKTLFSLSLLFHVCFNTLLNSPFMNIADGEGFLEAAQGFHLVRFSHFRSIIAISNLI